MQVLKFGGSSVANAANISKVVAIALEKVKLNPTIVVVSALGGITDLLLSCCNLAAAGDETYKEKLRQAETRHLEAVTSLLPLTQQSSLLSHVKKCCNELEDVCNGIFLLGELSERTKDRVVGYGELLSSQIIAAKIKTEYENSEWADSRLVITTNSNYGNAAVDFVVTNQKITSYFTNNKSSLFVMPGFIASDASGVPTTLGRGGSDYTAAILAAGLNADLLEIWTDVSGMMTADPRIVSNVKIIPQISYQEAMELSHFGAKVIYPPTIQPVRSKGIPTWVKNTFAPEDPGTVIQEKLHQDSGSISGISSVNNVALMSLEGSGMVGVPGFSKRLFEALANKKINVILITQSSSEHSICVAIDAVNMSSAKQVVDEAFAYEIETKKVDPIRVETGLSVIAVVGDNMKNHTGISGKMFGALGRNGINVRAIAQGSSERNISAVISSGDVKKAINVLHEEFFETAYKEINVFVAGLGNVGTRLMAQLEKQKEYLLQHLRLKINVAGIINSRTMLLSDQGIELTDWKEKLALSAPANIDLFVAAIEEKNLRNSVFVDITASKQMPNYYERLLSKSIGVVACNKVACSSNQTFYSNLKKRASEFNAAFLFETNVGASLPVISTLNDLLRSGDEIKSIEAVLSGTLNFVFNNYDGTSSFSSVVKAAQEQGYTEPDPRLDLNGSDVMRKIMILAREAGYALEMDDITNESFMPEACMKGSVEDFYHAMEINESHFKELFDKASQKGNKLKFVASFKDGKASVGLKHIEPSHDFYHLYGKDNIVLFYTNRYQDYPLVIKGAGAGADVTASGIFGDIIKTIR